MLQSMPQGKLDRYCPCCFGHCLIMCC
jgi:hypothetical protein